MIGKVQRGSDPAGLLRYLFGPGRANEHTDQHVIAHWAGRPDTVVPTTQAGFDLCGLNADLRTDLHAAGILGKPGTVWHTSVSLPAADGPLSDAQWRAVAEQIVAEAGLEDEHPGAVRWVAVRHGPSRGGNDHIHIVAALATTTDTGEHVDRTYLPRDYAAVRRVCLRLERAWGLTATSPPTGAAHQLPQRAEREIAARLGHPLPQRLRLERAVRSAAVASGGPAEFSARLARENIHPTFTRPSRVRAGTWLGVTFSSPDYTTTAGVPVQFSGRKLAADLTARALQARWDSAAAARGLAITGSTGQLIAGLADQLHAAAIHAPVPVLRGHVASGADALWAAAEATEADRGGPWHTAAAEAARAAREPGPVDPTAGSALRGITHGLVLRPRAQTKAEIEMARAHDFFRRLLTLWAAHDTPEPARVAAAAALRMSRTTPTPTAAGTRPHHHVGHLAAQPQRRGAW